MLSKEELKIHSPLPVFFFFSGSEIARQAAQIKMMRKLEKKALAQAAKEAKRQKGKAIYTLHSLDACHIDKSAKHVIKKSFSFYRWHVCL